MLSDFDGVMNAMCVFLCRGFPVKKCIMLKHLSKEPEGIVGSRSPPAKRSCPDLEVNGNLESKRFEPRVTTTCGYNICFICF